ncbi:MAG TPA: phage terminase small subunit P27 family [Steroidobacteraceae bacterium]|nr:phage terminase small subunit P27 family [Steroidobacteraceae bacterium]
MPNYRKTDRAKRTAGTFRQDRTARKSRSRRVVTIPDPPAHLTELARPEWLRLAPPICAQRTLAETDLRSLELLCEVLGTANQAQATLAKEGLTIRSGDSVRAHPAVKILEGARAQATRLLIEFGCTPRARGHVEPAADADPANPFAELSK